MVFKVLKCNDYENTLKLSLVWEGHIQQNSINIIVLCLNIEFIAHLAIWTVLKNVVIHCGKQQ